MKTASAIFFFLIFAGKVLAQTSPSFIDSTSQNNFIITEFENNVNTARLNSRINYTFEKPKLLILFRNFYNSDVSKLSQNFYRDLDNLKLEALYLKSNKLNFGGGVKSSILSDQRITESSINNNVFIYSAANYSLTPDIGFKLNAGLKRENQIGEISSGFSGEFKSDIPYLNIENYIARSNLSLSYDALDKKKNYQNDFLAELYKKFNDGSSNTGIVKYYSLRRDFFVTAASSISQQYGVTNNIESRVESAVQVEDYFQYHISKNGGIKTGGLYLSKTINRDFKYDSNPQNVLIENIYDTKILENKLEFFSTLSHKLFNFSLNTEINYSERSENHEVTNPQLYTQNQLTELEKVEKNKNNNSKKTSLNYELMYDVSKVHSLSFKGYASILHYDTDSKTNFDDRDEQIQIYSVSHIYDNRNDFRVKTSFDVNVSKLQYIFAERSANNYTNRIYKFTSESEYNILPNLITKNSFQVLANYTVYDFEDIISQIKSFSYRQLNLKDSTLYEMNKHISFEIFGEAKIYEQGEFNNNQFSINPVFYNVDKSAFFQLNYRVNSLVKISGKTSFFEQQIYNYQDGNKQLKSTFSTSSLMGKIFFYLGKNSLINFTYSVDYLKYDAEEQNYNTNSISLNVFYNF
ncbi:MAG: hypothetical protein K1X86_11535 [Ignavibacteria bacterium]|nr:hypothetical protein [Ignavibacteria bacterium]